MYVCVFMYVCLSMVVHACAETDSEDSSKAAAAEPYCGDIFIQTSLKTNGLTQPVGDEDGENVVLILCFLRKDQYRII